MKEYFKKILSITLLLALILSPYVNNSVSKAKLPYEQEAKVSKYVSAMKSSRMFPNVRLFSEDNHGYFVTYDYNGHYCKKVGYTSKMYFSDFAKKLGGSASYSCKKYTVTKTGNKLTSLGAGTLVSYICTKCGVLWYSSFAISIISDEIIDKYLRKPGTYRLRTVNAIINPYDVSMGCYMYYSYSFCKVISFEKKVDGKWKTITKNSKPIFLA